MPIPSSLIPSSPAPQDPTDPDKPGIGPAARSFWCSGSRSRRRIGRGRETPSLRPFGGFSIPRFFFPAKAFFLGFFSSTTFLLPEGEGHQGGAGVPRGRPRGRPEGGPRGGGRGGPGGPGAHRTSISAANKAVWPDHEGHDGDDDVGSEGLGQSQCILEGGSASSRVAVPTRGSRGWHCGSGGRATKTTNACLVVFVTVVTSVSAVAVGATGPTWAIHQFQYCSGSNIPSQQDDGLGQPTLTDNVSPEEHYFANPLSVSPSIAAV